MAQADSVPSSTRQLITGESASQSTNLPAVRIKPSDHDYVIADLGARSIMGDDKAALLLRHYREKHGGTAPAGPLNRRWYEANAGWVPAGSNIGTLSDACRLLWNVLLIVLRKPKQKFQREMKKTASTAAKGSQLLAVTP
jgi:hypothetical protein